MDGSRAEVARDKFRAEIMGRAISAGYRPLLHLLGPALIALATGALALAFIRNLRLVELWTVPVTYVLGLGLEWRAHKDLLHRRVPPFAELYDRHERSHHVVFTADDMAMRDPKEAALVLLPWFATVFVLMLLIPVGLLGAWLMSRNSGLLAVSTGVVFFVSYEWLHWAYHLPATHPISQLWIVRRLGALHRSHHDPRNMKRWNFNITVPLFDVLHRTLLKP